MPFNNKCKNQERKNKVFLLMQERIKKRKKY